MMVFSCLVHRFNDVCKDVWIGNGSKVELCVSDRFYLPETCVLQAWLRVRVSRVLTSGRGMAEVMLVIGGAGGGDRIQDPPPL